MRLTLKKKMSTDEISKPLDHVRTRFEFNIKRVRSLISIFELSGDQPTDILRAAVVFLHATLEDALRGMLLWKLPQAPAETLRGILFNGLFPGTADRLEKISLSQLRQHSGKTVDEICQIAIAAHLDRESYNDKEDVGRALVRLGIPVKDFGGLIDKLEPAIRRRHDIVHQSDRKPAGPDHGKPRAIESKDVVKWVDVVAEFIEKSLAFFEPSRIEKEGALIKPITRKKFDAFRPTREALAELLTQEKAWYSDRPGNILGTVLYDRTDKDWGWVMLARDEKGKFRAIDTGASLKSMRAASDQLIKKMALVSASGQKVFNQD